MRPTLAGLRVFAAVAETGNIRRAADRLGRTPSSVSEQLALFEAEVGAALFETSRKARLTAAGRFVHGQVRDLLSHYERMAETVGAYARHAVGRVDVASVPSVAVSVLPAVIAQFRAQWPDVVIDVRDGDSDSVAGLVVTAQVELGLASPAQNRPGLAFAPLFEDRLGVVCRRDDPLAQADTLPRAALDGRTMLANGITGTSPPDAAPIVVRNVLSLLALVRAGIGITLLPRLSLADAPDLAFVPVDEPDARRTVGVVSRAGESLSPAAAAFLALVRDALAADAGRLGVTLLGD